MPEKPLKIATYAASASVAALILGYIFGPTLFPNDESSGGGRKKSVVGLSNPANDCFINSVLQAFAGLGFFKEYLAQESQLHVRDQVDDLSTDSSSDDTASLHGVSEEVEKKEKNGRTRPPESNRITRALKDKVVTRALNTKLGELSESSAYKKTISAGDFVRVLEFAFGAHISRQQQDAQEFFHIVSERLCDEFHASRNTLQRRESPRHNAALSPQKREETVFNTFAKQHIEEDGDEIRNKWQFGEDSQEKKNSEELFAFEGNMESQIECQECHFKPKPNVSSFVSLTLNVPQRSSTTLDDCLDGLLKIEYIDGYKCDRCRIQHALQIKTRQLAQAESSVFADVSSFEREVELLQRALSDPENPPATIELPDTRPERRIAKHIRISTYPGTLALHLSRSIFNRSSFSMKNSARVEFPETLKLGGILQRKKYKLACVVTHRGGHNSGHYETYRRQAVSNSVSSSTETPEIDQKTSTSVFASTSDHYHKPEIAKNTEIEISSVDEGGETHPGSAGSMRRNQKSRDKDEDRSKAKWWCISDDKVRACSIAEVLGLQREAYLLFYELEGNDG